MSAVLEFAETLSEWALQMAREHGMVVALLSVVGIVSIVSAIGQKCFIVFRYFFILFIATPAILILGLVNKDNRETRIKELGEITAHLKENPDKWKKLIYYGMFCVLIIVVGLVCYWAFNNFVMPLGALNEFSKQALNNSINITK